MTFLLILSLILWTTILFLPWRPWSTKQSLEPLISIKDVSLKEITVLIPARNEEDILKKTLPSVINQGFGLNIIVIDDQSNDNTKKVAEEILNKYKDKIKGVVLEGKKKPPKWSGKLWALQQGLEKVNTRYVLLLDADIYLKDKILKSALKYLKGNNLGMVSLMAMLRTDSFIERLFIPSFIYFFKLLYPFSLVNKKNSFVAGAAGGFILTKSSILKSIGAFESLKDALIDDCRLAQLIKKGGNSIFLALTHGVISIRSYNSLNKIWQMVSRTAYTQLKYNPFLLALVAFIMMIAFFMPLIGLFSFNVKAVFISTLTLLIMAISYMPILRYYGLSSLWAFSLPVVGIFYLFMTLSSAKNYYLGKKAQWKGRIYSKGE